MNKVPEVSIVIPSLNLSSLLKNCIFGIAKTCDVSFEVIVVNQASSDDTKEYLETTAEGILKQNSNFVRLISLHLPGNTFISGGINRGILAASGKYLSIVANDVLVSPNLFSWAIRNLEKDPKIGTISPYTIEDERLQDPNVFYANYDKIPKNDKWAKNWHQSICQIFTREMWNKVGEWDERMRTHQMDCDHGQRIFFAGFSPTAWEGIIAYHHRGSFGRAQMKKESSVAKQDSRYYLKKWGVFPDKPYEAIPECMQKRASEGQYLSKGQLNNKNKIRQTELREPGMRIN